MDDYQSHTVAILNEFNTLRGYLHHRDLDRPIDTCVPMVHSKHEYTGYLISIIIIFFILVITVFIIFVAT